MNIILEGSLLLFLLCIGVCVCARTHVGVCESKL